MGRLYRRDRIQALKCHRLRSASRSVLVTVATKGEHSTHGGDWMFRKILVIPVLLVALAGCGTSNTATTAGGGAEQSSSPTSMAQASDCPTASTQKFPKTRVCADAGLAFAAVPRGIY